MMQPSFSSLRDASDAPFKPPKNAKTQNKSKAKVKPTQKQTHSTPHALVSNDTSVFRLAESSSKSVKPPAGGNSNLRQPLPPLISHDISITDDEHDATLHMDDDATPLCGLQCCSRSVSVLWDNGCAIRLKISRARSRFTGEVDLKHGQHSDELDSAGANSSINVRVPLLLFALLLILIGCWMFVDVGGQPHGLLGWRSGGGPGGPASKFSVSGKPPSLQQLYHFPAGKNSSLIATDADQATSGEILSEPNSNVGSVVAGDSAFPNDSPFLSTSYLVVATTPTGAPGPGLHVPCQWLEERYGKAEQFTELRAIIELVRKGIEPPVPTAPSTTVTKAATTETGVPFIPTEKNEVSHLMDSVGIYCQTDEVRDKCEFDGISKHSSSASLSSIEVSRLQRWYLALPEDARYEDEVRTSESATSPPFVVLNKFTGAIATLNCRNKIRYSSPFSNNELANVYIEPNNNALPLAYAEFIANKCTKEARVKAEEETKAKAHAAHSHHTTPIVANTSSTTEPPVTEPAKHPKWIEPLIPLLPPICGPTTFTRPSTARACLRNSRIITFGDSTLQELMLILVDFLEQNDGEDPADLTKMLDDTTAAGRARPKEEAKEWMPPNSGSDGVPRYLYLEIWATPESCKLELITHLSRIFSTARFPSPYLAAYNITITHQWNLDEDICANYRGPNWASSLSLHRMSYRRLTETCLPDNAVEIADKYRKKPDGTYRSVVEYFEHVNSLFHYLVRDRQVVYKEEPPPFGCKYPYLSPEEYNQLTLAEWQVHLPTVPSFDYGLLNMGAHQTRAWDMPDPQRGEAGYSYNPEQFHHAFEAHLQLVQSIVRHVVVRETSWRTDPHFGKTVPAINAILREVTIEAQARALQKDREVAAVMEAARQKNVDLTGLTPFRRSVSWLPTYHHTTLMRKEDAVHCSYKLIAGGNGVGNTGIRTPFCYGLLQNIIQTFCSKKSNK